MRRVVMAAMLCGALAGSASAGGPEWLENDYDRAAARAKETGKLVHVHWRRDGCHWCTDIEEKTFMADDVAAFLADAFVNVRMDRAKYGQLAGSFHVESTPESQFLAPDGRLVRRVIDFMPAAEFLAEAKAATAAWKRIQELEAAVSANAADARARLELGQALAEGGDLDGAEKQLRAAADSDKDGAAGIALEAWWTLGAALMLQEKPDVAKAKEALGKVQELDPKNQKGRLDNAAVQLARIQLNSDPKGARASLEKIAADWPQSDGAAEAQFLLAALLAEIDRNFDGAEAALKKLAADRPDDPWAKRVPGALEQLAVMRKENAGPEPPKETPKDSPK